MQLDKFYQEFQAWIDCQYPRHEIFTPYCGLCYNARRWAWAHNESGVEASLALKEQFRQAGLNEEFPFNEGMFHFDFEARNNKLYTNQQRLKWVAEHATR